MKTPPNSYTTREGSSLRRMVRAVARWTIFRVFLSERRWYRRLVGGRWERWHVDHPVCSCMWLDVPMDAPLDYREPLWRGTPEREVWLDGSNGALNDSERA
jgi:hypothetical protein